MNSACTPKRSSHRTLSSPAEVRELVSSATRRIFASGVRVNIATEATGPRDAIAMPGTIR